MKYTPDRGRLGASLKAVNSMLSRDERRDVIKMAVVIGGGGGGGGRRRSTIVARRTSVAIPAAGKNSTSIRLRFDGRHRFPFDCNLTTLRPFDDQHYDRAGA